MKAARGSSLQRRLLVGVIGLVAAVWLGVVALTWADARHELDELLDSHLAQAAALLVAQQAPTIEHDDDRLVDAPLLHRYASKAAFQVWHEGRLVLRSANAPAAWTGADAPAQRGLAPGFRTIQIDGTDWRVFTTRGAERDVQVFVGEQIDSRAHILRALLRAMLGPMALALPLLAGAGWWAVRRGLAPLREMGHALATRDPRALQPLALPDAPSEMAPMVDALNGLFERIGALLESERRFTADAAHELRTPIAAIRAQAQVALAETDDALRRHALQSTLEGCDRAARLVEQLLTLSRLEAAQAAPAGEIDLAAIARRVTADIGARALARGQQVELSAGSAVPVRGDETLLAVLVRNLVDNAVRYSPDGARIQIAVQGGPDGQRLVVEDSGPGLGDADLARLGERFFRVLGTQASGSGLGWSIVRRIARVQGASVAATRSPALGGLRVVVAWPAAQ
jgi:two-component system, OmpR family, sensor histidine kinase QseC